MDDKMKNFLEHYGVLGMRWGQRKGRKTIASNDRRRIDNINTKSIKKLSNKELQDVITRKQLEKSYKSLTMSKMDVGKKLVSDILVKSAKQTATTFVSKQMTKFVDSAYKKYTE
jgi:methyl coenzyme M reductase gamma subunit